MQGTQPRRPVRGSGASQDNRGIVAELTQDTKSRDALERIHAAIVATSRERPLSRLEIRIRCLSAPRPWRDAGVCSTTWYRRKKKLRAVEAIRANPNKSNRAIAAELGVSDMTVKRAREASGATFDAPERIGRDGKSYPATQRQAVAA
jgi:hypothetical protein